MEKKMKMSPETGQGLCSTCVNDPVCTFPRMPGVYVRNCLEFQGELLDEPARSVTAARPMEPASPRREPGLCSWCERKPACTYPKPSGGVWFCEEYL